MSFESLSASHTIVILQRVLPHYRVEFFSRLSQRLNQKGIKLRVLYGQERPGSVPRSVYPENEWAEYIPNRYMSCGNTELVWQRVVSKIGKPDLIIIEQANRLLVNYPLLLLRTLRCFKLAYWGHGRNLQSLDKSNLKEKVKRELISSVDWWFAYTKLSEKIIRSTGYTKNHISVVENAINTDEFKLALDEVSSEDLVSTRAELGLSNGPIALYCGGMYPDKKLAFLLEAAEHVQKRVSNFNLILIGNGPDEALARQASEKHTWVHFLGSVFGKERAVYFVMSDLMLMPGLVGLAIVDSFVAGLPIITTDIPIHSPEIAYLQNNVNGLLTEHSIDEYVDAVVNVLSDKELMFRLKQGCCESANHYTLDAMVENFSSGIFDCLGVNEK